MNLRCPHCNQTVSVSDHLAGQVMRCAACGGEFTVPVVPMPTPAQAQREQPSAMQDSPTGTGKQPYLSEAATERSKNEGPRYLGFTEPRFSVPLHPEVVRWVVPVCQVLMFVFFFFPWLSSPLGEPFNFSQSAFGAAFGFAGSSSVQSPAPAPWLILLFIVLLLGVLSTVALLVHRFVLPLLGKEVPPVVAAVVDKRSFILGGLAVLAFLFLTLQVVLGLPAESLDFSAATPESFPGSKELFGQLMAELVRRTVWLRISFTLALVGLLGALANFWLERRLSLPPPQLTVQW